MGGATSDPVVTLRAGAVRRTSDVKKGTVNPWYNQTFALPLDAADLDLDQLGGGGGDEGPSLEVRRVERGLNGTRKDLDFSFSRTTTYSRLARGRPLLK